MVGDEEHRPLAGDRRVGRSCGDTQKHGAGTGFDLLELG